MNGWKHYFCDETSDMKRKHIENILHMDNENNFNQKFIEKDNSV